MFCILQYVVSYVILYLNRLVRGKVRGTPALFLVKQPFLIMPSVCGDPVLCCRLMFSVTSDRLTCDDVNIRIRAFTQLHSVAVSLKRLPELLLYGCRSTQTIETHHLETHNDTQVGQVNKTFDRVADIFTTLSIKSALKQCAGKKPRVLSQKIQVS